MVFQAKDKETIISRYSQRYKEFGYHCKTVGWGDRKSQRQRFHVLSEIEDLSGSEIIDVGCGFGDFFRYLSNRFSNINYTGIDIVKEFVEEGKRRYPETQFLVQDILEPDFNMEGDFYFLSGTLNVKLEDNLNYTKEMIEKMFRLSRKALGLNFLSKYVDYELDKDFHHSPEGIFSFGREQTKFVTLRHDYPLWEFTVYLYKEGYIEEKHERAGRKIAND